MNHARASTDGPTPTETVVITGAGLHVAFGDGDAAWHALTAGQSALGMHPLSGVTQLPAIAGAPTNANPAAYCADPKLVKYMSPVSKLAVLAAGRALARAGLDGDPDRRAALGLFVTTGLIAFDPGEVARAIAASKTESGALCTQRMGQHGLKLCHPLMPFKMLLNMPIGLISMLFGVRGENAITYPGAAQASANLESAVRSIASGRLPGALVGGAYHGVSLFPVCTLLRQGRLAKNIAAAQPFTEQHQGYAPADGAAFVVLESLTAAQARGAQPLAIVDAVGCSVTAPSADDAAVDVVLVSGNLDAADDRATLDALATRPSAAQLCCLDGHVGHLGPAVPFLLAALACDALARGDARPLAPSQGAASPLALAPPSQSAARRLDPRTIQIVARDADGAAGTLRLTRPHGRAAGARS